MDGMHNNIFQTEAAVLSRQENPSTELPENSVHHAETTLQATDENYATLLDFYGIQYKVTGPYLQAGQPRQVQGWILHVSVIKTQLFSLLEKILPVLQSEQIPFIIPVNPAQAEHLLSGAAGYRRLGKLITVYPSSADQAVRVAQKLIVRTADYRGPVIPTDRHLGGSVYTNFGHFGINADENDNQFTVPFRLPAGIKWPFSKLATSREKKPGKLIRQTYLPMVTLKADVKGKVFKALDVKRWLHIRWCLVKQGKACLCADPDGRDIRDRLFWQQEVHRDLKGHLPVPEIYDCFDYNGDTYLVMELIEGPSLRELIDGIFRGRAWFDLSSAEQLQLLHYLLQVIEIIEKLHTLGYIHRDITPRNFLQNSSGQLVPIDLELSYNSRRQKPYPPFTLGTAGYLSPEQQAVVTPDFPQDIYSLGALMIEFFTGISPMKLSADMPVVTRDNIYFLVGYGHIARLITTCLSADPTQRPGLNTIKRQVLLLQKEVMGNKIPVTYLPEVFSRQTIRSLIHYSLAALATRRFTGPDGIWFSKTVTGEKFINNETAEFSYYAGIHEGVAGILYLLAEAKLAGYNIDTCREAYQKNLAYLLQTDFWNLPSGFFNGTPGIAVSLAKGLEAGLIEKTDLPESFSSQCFVPDRSDKNELNIATGVAGIGLAWIQYNQYTGGTIKSDFLEILVQRLADTQQKDGSWFLTKKGIQEKGIQLFSLFYGIAGIIYFLLETGRFYPEGKGWNIAKKGLDYLASQARWENGHWIWQVNPQNQTISPWLEDGFTGITLVFIKAYEVFREEKYRTLAESVLSNHPVYILSNQLTLSGGLAGLGEVYLEAYRVFQNAEWQKRADWITGVLLHTCKQQDDGSVYWLQDHSTIPVADLMTGNAGIIHFLIRYDQSEKCNYE
jgi:serine/threonine protein kinase